VPGTHFTGKHEKTQKNRVGAVLQITREEEVLRCNSLWMIMK